MLFVNAGCSSGENASAQTPIANVATLTWSSVDPPVSGYRVYYGIAAAKYNQPPGKGIDVGNTTSYTVTGLANRTRYYFAVTAYYGADLESDYSNEVFKDIP
jgi:fibronectin type 3 domain-containing protein